MSKYGPIIIVEDDPDDQMIYKEIIESLHPNTVVKVFDNGEDALTYLLTIQEQPFVIICDINLPRMNGLELRRRINDNETLRKKSIPFVFLSTSDASHIVNEAYDLTVQGFFVKAHVYAEIGSQLKYIFDYWKYCKHPNIR
ncbi:CheY chemotaxis protein or a CheY-like REC (receiver) domain [Chitinophaga costaii]|uniref:CheY chemotaxis protein or a CheY-like REC (Receiver) domain n=1 Tax=Chitinophaga costaii TaxID=1335309 RepID=A0A1C4BJ08_9BACT|nr:response regulator [Chitinophaga costaii]PUZ27886.1 response regulator [Chitinophaga costaii]SCC06941.1 CheY chemotaxis protein or a CheY-like REC (receiver) domain [Chitinophaga costaii]